MSQYDRDLDRHFENGKRLLIEMGTEVLMQINGVAGRLPSVFVGMEANRYMIFKVPRAQVNLANKLTKGSGVVVRYRYQGRIYGFQSVILGTVSDPYGLLFLNSPNVVEEHNLRKKQRIDCYFPCTVEMPDRLEPGVVVNFSLQGCRCIFSALNANRETLAGIKEISVKITLSLGEFDEPLVLVGHIISAQQFHGAVSAGIRFAEMTDVTATKLKGYLAGWV